MVDYKGQLLGERIYQGVSLIFCMLGFALGFYKQDFGIVVRFIGTGMLVSAVLVLPDWAYFNKNPVNWAEATPSEAAATKQKKKKSKKSK